MNGEALPNMQNLFSKAVFQLLWFLDLAFKRLLACNICFSLIFISKCRH